jgi:hypothetical protein
MTELWRKRWLKRDATARHRITWTELVAWAESAGVHRTHAQKVFRGERASAKLEAAFQEHFGFPMRGAAYEYQDGSRYGKAAP